MEVHASANMLRGHHPVQHSLQAVYEVRRTAASLPVCSAVRFCGVSSVVCFAVGEVPVNHL